MKKGILFIKEYRGPTLSPPCDVIYGVIIMQNTFFGIIWDYLFIFEVKLKLCLIFQNFQNGRHFAVTKKFLPEMIPEVQSTRKIAINIFNILN